MLFIEIDCTLFQTLKDQNFFICLFTNPPSVIFRKVERKIISKIIFLFYPPTLSIICFLKKMRFCLCIFETDIVKSDCPVQFL